MSKIKGKGKAKPTAPRPVEAAPVDVLVPRVGDDLADAHPSHVSDVTAPRVGDELAG